MFDARWESFHPRRLVTESSIDRQLSEIERTVDFQLPKQLSGLLDEFKGPIVFDRLVKFRLFHDDSTINLDFRLEMLYGLSEDRFCLLKNANLLDVSAGDQFIAFGEGSGGDKFCIRRADGSIYYWKHDSNNDLLLISASFDQFLNELIVVEESQYGCQGIDESKTWFSL